MVLQMQLVLDWEVPANGCLVLWMHVGMKCEGLPTSGPVVHWMRYQDRQGQTYLGRIQGRVASGGRWDGSSKGGTGWGVAWVEWVWVVMT